MDEDVVPLTANCPKCGRVAEVGYTYGRARVTSSEVWCANCASPFRTPGTASDSAPVAAAKRKGPKPASPRRIRPVRAARSS